MKSLGMHFGSHGLNHLWLGYLNKKSQFQEIKNSFDFLIENSLIKNRDPLIMCYPFGSYNEETISIMNSLKVDYSLTTDPGSAVFDKSDNRYQIKRWDTNHFWDNEYRKPIMKVS